MFCVDLRTNSDYFPSYSNNCLLFAVLWATCSVCAPVLVPLIACRWQCSCPWVAIKSYVALRSSPSDGWKDLLYAAMENRANRILGAAFVWRQSRPWLTVMCSPFLCSSPCRRTLYVSMLHSNTWHCHYLHIQPHCVNKCCKNILPYFEAILQHIAVWRPVVLYHCSYKAYCCLYFMSLTRLTHWGRVTQICVFTLQLCKTDDEKLRF